jgi:hypothetical protein
MKKTIIVIGCLCVSTLAFGATAMFTGRQQYVYTVTGKYVVKCEYQYLGNIFTRLFEGNCPQTVEVF